MTEESTVRRAPTGPALTSLTGLEPSIFRDGVWAQRPYLATADLRPSTRPVFTLDDADELLATRGLRTPFLRIAKDGQVLPAARFTGGGGAGARIGDQVRDERVLEAFANGSTLVFQGLHRNWLPVQQLAGTLAEELGHPVQVNAYLTPASSRGFSAHYDTHDVFVVQVAGRKSWRCFPPPIDAPLPSQEWTQVRDLVDHAATAEPEIAATLAPGDCLYLPRGWIHEATALGDTTLHLTIGVHPITRADLVRRAVERALASEVELRRSLPAGVDTGDVEQIGPELLAAIDALTKALVETDVHALALAMAEQRWTDVRPAAISPVRQAATANSLSESTPVRIRPGSHVRVHWDEEVAVLRAGDRHARLPHTDALVVQAILDGESVTVGQLAADVDDALVVGRELLIAGLVIPAS